MASRVFRQTALDRLSSPEQLDQLVRVANPQGWAALGVLTGLLAVALLWGWFGSIPVEVAGDGILQSRNGGPVHGSHADGEELQAILFLPPGEARKVSAGMEARILPAELRREEHGFIRGEVRRLDAAPMEGRWTQIEVALERDSNASGGYRWSSPGGPDRDLPSGTRITGTIVVERHRPLSVLIPGLRGRGAS